MGGKERKQGKERRGISKQSGDGSRCFCTEEKSPSQQQLRNGGWVLYVCLSSAAHAETSTPYPGRPLRRPVVRLVVVRSSAFLPRL